MCVTGNTGVGCPRMVIEGAPRNTSAIVAAALGMTRALTMVVYRCVPGTMALTSQQFAKAARPTGPLKAATTPASATCPSVCTGHSR